MDDEPDAYCVVYSPIPTDITCVPNPDRNPFTYSPFVLRDIYLKRLRNVFYLYMRVCYHCYHGGLCAAFDFARR